MPTPEIYRLAALLEELQASAQPRPDLITPGSTGRLENARPVTFAGRVTRGGETPEQILNRTPIGELESGGQVLSALPQRILQLATILPARTAQEKVVQALMQRHPELYKRAQADPRKLRTVVKSMDDALGQFDPKTNTIKINPDVLAGKQVGTYSATPEQAVIHELTHYLSEPRVTRTSPSHALESAEQITKLMEGTQAQSFMQNYLDQARQLRSTAERLSSSIPMSGAERDAFTGIGPRRAYSEALSYLQEQSLRSTDPLVKALANALNLQQ